MQNILLHGIHVNDFKKLISEVIDEKLKQVIKPEKASKNTEFLNRLEVAKLLKISLPTLNEWSKTGILQSYRIGNRVLYKQDEVVQSVSIVANLKYRRV